MESLPDFLGWFADLPKEALCVRRSSRTASTSKPYVRKSRGAPRLAASCTTSNFPKLMHGTCWEGTTCNTVPSLDCPFLAIKQALAESRARLLAW